MRARSSALLASLMVLLPAVPAAAQERHAEAAADLDGQPLSDESALLEKALQFDPSSLAATPAKSLKLPRLKRPQTVDVSRTNAQPDGSGTVVVKQTLPTEWDAKVGADLGLAGNNPVSYQPLAPLDAYQHQNRGNAVWASIAVTDMASVDARVDPTNDQGRLAGVVKHSMPVGSSLSLTLQNSVSVTETYGTQAPTAPAGLPMKYLPQENGTAPSQVFGKEQAVKFNILSTGTTLGAAVASTSADPITHKTLTAEQKVVGPLSVTTSVTDVGEATANKSISARFKLNW